MPASSCKAPRLRSHPIQQVLGLMVGAASHQQVERSASRAAVGLVEPSYGATAACRTASSAAKLLLLSPASAHTRDRSAGWGRTHLSGSSPRAARRGPRLLRGSNERHDDDERGLGVGRAAPEVERRQRPGRPDGDRYPVGDDETDIAQRHCREEAQRDRRAEPACL